MRIEKLWIEDFGKFHQQKFNFAPGLNIFTGANESGKTTMRRFIRAMFYGLERERGLRARTDDYTKYAPWEFGNFQGSMEFVTEDGRFRLFRNFKTKELKITNLTTGKQVADPEKFLKEAGLVSETAYCNTLWVGNVCETENGLADELQNYLANLKMTGAVGLDVQKSLDWLKEQKRSLQRRLPEQEIAELNELLLSEGEAQSRYEQLLAEQKQLSEQERRLGKEDKAQEAVFPEEQWNLRLKEQKQEKEKRERALRSPKVLLIGGTLGVFSALLLLLLSLVYQGVFLLGVSALLLLAGIALYTAGKKRLDEVKKILEDMKRERELAVQEFTEFQRKQQQERREIQTSREKQLLEQLARNAWETERAEERLKRIEQAKERLSVLREQKEQLVLEIRAVELAAEKITEASGAMYDDFGQRFQGALSTYVRAFTDCAYERLVADEQLKLGAITPERTVAAESVSFGTKEQFYLALRLAAADVFDEKKRLPLIADDSFAAFDGQRLESALMCLASCGRQVLLFSSTGREEQTAKRMGITYETVFEDNQENFMDDI